MRDVRQRFRENKRYGKELLLSSNLMAQACTDALSNIAGWQVKHKDRASKEDIIEQINKLIMRLFE
ncbi:hypothetical protein [Lutispora thermophila]|uniref:hypothetical protein n=1 Tax=Lutispora thermophila TaxID=288966 RepID=UPI0009344255|nr:hypothetical protein [Lutispora thermophila]